MLLRPQHSLHYICEWCNGDFRFAAISGPKTQPFAAIAKHCPFCGKATLRWLPNAISKGATAS